MSIDMTNIVSHLTAYLTAAAVFADELERLDDPREVALAYSRYAQVSITAGRLAWRSISLPPDTFEPWELHVHQLCANPTDVLLWEDLVLAMVTVAKIHDHLYAFVGVWPEDVKAHRDAHIVNMDAFHQGALKAADGNPPSQDVLKRVLRWAVFRGAELGRRNVMIVLAAKAPDQVPYFLPFLTPREGRP